MGMSALSALCPSPQSSFVSEDAGQEVGRVQQERRQLALLFASNLAGRLLPFQRKAPTYCQLWCEEFAPLRNASSPILLVGGTRHETQPLSDVCGHVI